METIELKRVLAAVDFSAWTGPVLRTAAELARRYRAALSAVYAEPFLPPPYFTERGVEQMAGVLEAQRQAARRYLEETVRRELGEGAGAETDLVEAWPAAGILHKAEVSGAGLIVMGTHGRGGLNRFLLGSVAEKVVRAADVPVLTISGVGEGRAPRLPFQRILCPVNYTPAARDALRYAADLAGRSGAELILMTSLEERGASEELRRDHEQRLCASVPESVRARCTLSPVVRQGDAAEQILKLAADAQCDLVVIGAQHRPLLETTIIGTTSVRVMRHASCPVLTVSRRRFGP
jgi:nucleotide-binding universal stress UspA family protein